MWPCNEELHHREVMGKLGEGRQMWAAQPVTALGSLGFGCITSCTAFMQTCVIVLLARICSEMGEGKSWGVRISVVMYEAAHSVTSEVSLTTGWGGKSAHVNPTNLLLPAVLVAKMTNQPLCRRETSKTQCRVEIQSCWDRRRSQAPLSPFLWVGGCSTRVWGMVWAAGCLPEHPSGLATAWFIQRGRLAPWKSLQMGLLFF